MSPVDTLVSPVPPLVTARALVKDKLSNNARVANKSLDVAAVMSTVPSVLDALFKFCIVDEAVTTIEVPVPFVNASCGKVFVDVVVAVKKVARTSPAISSLASDVVAVAPINTWLVLVET